MENTNPNRRSIEKDRFINSSPQRVFQALTEKAELERWFVRTADIDLRPGGEVSFEWDRAKGVFEHGKVLIVEPPTQFSCTWEAMEPSPTILTFTLSAHDGGTRLQFLHMGMGEGEFWETYVALRNHGWDMHLQHLTDWLETGTCPPPGPIPRQDSREP